MINSNYVLPEYNDWFRPYPFLFFAGFLISLSLIFIKAKRKNLPLVPFEKFIFIVIPISLLFASFFGKFDYIHPLPFYELFFFWQAGLSIHGAMIGALVAYFIYFPAQSKKYKISMWVWLDIIAPNVLIGQIIGRWGNFFNHEILGQPVTYQSLFWLPDFIKNSCFRFNLNAKFLTPEFYPGTHNIIYRQPLFIYEIIGLAILYIMLTFIVPNSGKWFGKKPWKYQKLDFDISNLTRKGKWNKLYYELEVDQILAKKYSSNYQYIKINPKLKKHIKFKFSIINKKGYWKYLIKRDSKQLTILHNKYNITVIRSGVTGSLFFFGYNFIRIFIEFQRSPQELFIKNLPIISYSTIIIFMIIGFISFIFAQFIAPYKWRFNKWYYEKQY